MSPTEVVARDVIYPQRVVVTGAASGIGKATARLLHQRGTEVLAVDLNERGLSDLPCDTAVCDITREEHRARLCETAGAVGGLVNAAGIIRLSAIPDVSDSEWDAIFAVNVKALFFLARDLGRRMGEGGVIVNLSSVAAKMGATTEALAYASSKAAVLAVTRGLAVHFGPSGVRVNAVLPGIIDTPMQDAVVAGVSKARGVDPAELHRQRLQTIALQNRAGSPEDVADLITLLLSSGARYVTGQAICVDGGQVMD